MQNWNGVDRRPAYLYHFAAFIESYEDSLTTSSLYAQIGYHKRGSAERTRFITTANNIFDQRLAYHFNNISLNVGGKRIINPYKKLKPYYLIGVRLDYTVSTNLDDFTSGGLSAFGGYFPVDVFVNKFNYGFTVGGGFQQKLTDHLGAAIEFNIHPDLSKQYNQPRIPNVSNPFNPGNTIELPMQEVRNISLEISFILRLLRKVEYID